MTRVLQRHAKGFGGASTAPPTFLIVFCHGYGGDSSQLAPLAEAFSFPGAACYFADAPTRCPFSFHDALRASRGRQWFPLERPLPAYSAHAEEAASALNHQVDLQLARRALPEDAVLFVGFSQGAMVSLLAGLARPVAPRGIVSIAGALLVREGAFAPTCRPPVLLLHAAADSVVPASRSQEAALHLQHAGIGVQLTLLPELDHVIVTESAPYVSAFIAGTLT